MARRAMASMQAELARLTDEFGEWADSIRIAAAEPAGWLESKMAARLVLHTKDDRSFEGTVVMVAPDGVVLRAAKLLDPTTVELGGEVWLPRSEILFAQTIPV